MTVEQRRQLLHPIGSDKLQSLVRTVDAVACIIPSSRQATEIWRPQAESDNKSPVQSAQVEAF
eukprot:6357418-Amphidinium_carterae.1